MATEEQLKRRRERFSKESSKPSSYGLVSRGDDLRLKDEKERKKLFSHIKKLCGEKSPPKDEILLGLRKLREAILDKQTVDNEANEIYVFSIQEAVKFGHYQTYLPLLLNVLKALKLDNDQLGQFSSYLVLHLTHFNQEYQKAIRVYFDYRDQLTINSYGRQQLNHSFELARLLILQRYDQWFRYYHECQHNPKLSIELLFLKMGYHQVVSHAVTIFNRSYFILPAQYLQDYFQADLNEVIKDTSWRVQNDSIVIRERNRQ
ncbi:BA75_01324T0 [Komagataella pastoris]|uniref:BA75_01324T0 n=1 Tax=Komagataella pastoris TaxID=4922 RepID=A0A1B2J8T2_PICPA|nr:BA75_01324T0 [Komagataella pastoris]